MRSRKLISCMARPIPGPPTKEGDSAGYGGYNKVNGSKLSALANKSSLSLSCAPSRIKSHDSQFYASNLNASEIPGTEERPAIISAAAVHDAGKFRQYGRNR